MKGRIARAPIGLCWLALACAISTRAGESIMTNEPPQSHPEQKPPPGLGQALEQMKEEADKAIHQISADSGSVAARHRTGIFEVFAAMRPRFGPANAQLFNEREKKLVDLARALGVAEHMPPDVDGHSLDRYFDAVERSTAALRERGLQVGLRPVSSSAIDWAPNFPGRMLRAVDPSRTLPQYIPYAELRPDKPVPKDVSPSVTLYFFPIARMNTMQHMMTRQQPGEVWGAVEGAYVFTLLAPQSGDTDDGKTADAAGESLFPGGKAVNEPRVAAAFGARTAEHLRGVLRVTAESPSPPLSPGSISLPAGIEAVLWSAGDGSEISHTLLPVR